MEEIKMFTCIVETNGSFEEDFDALMNLLDAACEIYVPGTPLTPSPSPRIAAHPRIVRLRIHSADNVSRIGTLRCWTAQCEILQGDGGD
jgi:hypothetical protein